MPAAPARPQPAPAAVAADGKRKRKAPAAAWGPAASDPLALASVKAEAHLRAAQTRRENAAAFLRRAEVQMARAQRLVDEAEGDLHAALQQEAEARPLRGARRHDGPDPQGAAAGRRAPGDAGGHASRPQGHRGRRRVVLRQRAVTRRGPVVANSARPVFFKLGHGPGPGRRGAKGQPQAWPTVRGEQVAQPWV